MLFNIPQELWQSQGYGVPRPVTKPLSPAIYSFMAKSIGKYVMSLQEHSVITEEVR